MKYRLLALIGMVLLLREAAGRRQPRQAHLGTRRRPAKPFPSRGIGAPQPGDEIAAGSQSGGASPRSAPLRQSSLAALLRRRPRIRPPPEHSPSPRPLRRPSL